MIVSPMIGALSTFIGMLSLESASFESAVNLGTSFSAGISYRYPIRRGKVISQSIRSSNARTRVGGGVGLGVVLVPAVGVKEKGPPYTSAYSTGNASISTGLPSHSTVRD